MKVGKSGVKNSLIARYLKRIYEKKWASVSEHIYYSMILRGEYPYVSDMFKNTAESEAEILRGIVGLLAELGIDTAVDTRIHIASYRGEEINEIIKGEVDFLRRSIDDTEGICALTDDNRIRDEMEFARRTTAENVRAFERMMIS